MDLIAGMVQCDLASNHADGYGRGIDRYSFTTKMCGGQTEKTIVGPDVEEEHFGVAIGEKILELRALFGLSNLRLASHFVSVRMHGDRYIRRNFQRAGDTQRKAGSIPHPFRGLGRRAQPIAQWPRNRAADQGLQECVGHELDPPPRHASQVCWARLRQSTTYRIRGVRVWRAAGSLGPRRSKNCR